MATTTRGDAWPFVGLACALAFAAVLTMIVGFGSLPFDAPLEAAIRAWPVPVEVWTAISRFGGSTLVVVGTVMTIVALLTGRMRLAVIIAIVLIGASLFTSVTKELVARPRPPDPLVSTRGFSFPSGHSLNSTTTYAILAIVLWRSRLVPWLRRAAVVAGIAIPFCVGVSRVGLGAHWPSDVLGGWLAGAAFVAVAATLITVTGAMARDLPRRPAPT